MKQLFILAVFISICSYSYAALECASGANACAQELFATESVATSADEICAAVDEAILCIANATRSCDPIAVADVASSMNTIIDEYKAQLSNCTLENENNPAFKLDPCSVGLAYCSDVLYQASIDTDLSQSCRLKDAYKECMSVNTTECDTTVKSTIDSNLVEAETTYNTQPFFCQHRMITNMTSCDEGYADCNTGLTSIGISALTSPEVCPLVETFSTCISGLSCPTEVQTYYAEVATNLTESFKDLPYFCGSENSCQDLFDACNDSLAVNIQDPCSLMNAHTACLTNIETLCEPAQMAVIRTDVENLNVAIIAQSSTNCQPTSAPPAGTEPNPPNLSSPPPPPPSSPSSVVKTSNGVDTISSMSTVNVTSAVTSMNPTKGSSTQEVKPTSIKPTKDTGASEVESTKASIDNTKSPTADQNKVTKQSAGSGNSASSFTTNITNLIILFVFVMVEKMV